MSIEISPAATNSPGLNRSQREVIKVWIAAGLWMGIIAVESTRYLSSENTGHYIFPILHYLFGISAKAFIPFHVVIRKSGHFIGYFILSVLLFRAWRATLPSIRRWVLRWSAIAFFMTALVASLDEWHQTYLPGRTGTIHDVFLDSTAGLVAQLVIAYFLTRKTRET